MTLTEKVAEFRETIKSEFEHEVSGHYVLEFVCREYGKALLIEELKKLREDDDPDTEEIHREADALLIEFIGDDKVDKAYSSIAKYYS